MKQPVRGRVHRILVIPKIWQASRNEGLQLFQCLRSPIGPGKILRHRGAESFYPCRLNLCPQAAVVVCHIPRFRCRRFSLPGLAIIVVEIPLSALGRAILFHQQIRAFSHHTVIRLHEPALRLGLEMLGHSFSFIQKMLRRFHRRR